MLNKKITGFSLGIVFVLSLFPILLYFNLGREHPVAYFANDMFRERERVATLEDEPKIALFAGSSVYHGFNAETMSHQLDRRVVNLGFTGSFMGYLLDSGNFKKYIFAGDTVIFPLEYWTYGATGMGSSMYWLGVALADKDYILSKPLTEVITSCYGVSLKCWLVFMYEVYKGKKADVDMGYIFNDYGDLISSTAKQLPQEQLVNMSKASEKNDFDHIISSNIKIRLHEFILWCKENDIKLYAAFPIYFAYRGYFTEKERASIQAIKDFYASEGIEILNEPEDMLYDVEYFLDSEYHLNTVGKEKNTEYWIKLLEAKGIAKRRE